MLNDIQIKHVKKLQKLAKKNIFCKYLATVLIIISLFFRKFYGISKRVIITVVILTIILISSFIFYYFFAVKGVHSFKEVNSHTELEQTVQENQDQIIKENNEIDIENDIANLDDLIEENSNFDLQEEESDFTKFDKNDWKLILINKQHPIPEDYQFTLGTIKGSMRCDERIITHLIQMFEAAKEDGVNLVVCSPYRDMQRQEWLFDRKMKKFLNQGMSYMEAYKTASITVTLPGASEHQVGLAVDIICDTYVQLNEGFEKTEAGKWLKEHSWEHGFILRYPKGKEDVTGIRYEPWHFRYVGKEAAELIYKEDICLEEFLENI